MTNSKHMSAGAADMDAAAAAPVHEVRQLCLEVLVGAVSYRSPMDLKRDIAMNPRDFRGPEITPTLGPGTYESIRRMNKSSG